MTQFEFDGHFNQTMPLYIYTEQMVAVPSTAGIRVFEKKDEKSLEFEVNPLVCTMSSCVVGNGNCPGLENAKKISTERCQTREGIQTGKMHCC